MKVTAGSLLALGVAHFAQVACTQATDGGGLPSASRDALTLTRFAEEDVADVGIGEVHPIGADEKDVEQALVDSLEARGQTTVVGQVELGELLCDSLDDASGATLLRFALSSTETVIAERTSYSTVDGSVLPDGKGRKLWVGEVVDPEPPAGALPRTVTMTWTDPCDVESFLLKVVSPKEDERASIVKSVPCAAGSSTELCMVELDVAFSPNGDVVMPELEGPVESSNEEDVPVPQTLPPVDADVVELQAQELLQVPSHRRLQGTTEIDVLVVYATELLATEAQLLTTIVAGFSTANEATANSDIDLQFNVVRVDQLPYSQTTDAYVDLAALRTNADVQALRDEVQADLVVLVGEFVNGICGLAYFFNGYASYGYSVVDVDCFDNYSHTHEMAHNLGCDHDRENAGSSTEYGHGFRYCEGDVQYRTIMSYAAGCTPAPPRVNYFSNPDIDFLGLPTGTAEEDNARCIEDNMVAVSNFRTGALTCADTGATCTTADDCCSDFCGSAGVCATDVCGGAGGSLLTQGDSVCDPGNNNEECNYDSGDCCICDCVEPACGDGTCTTPAWSCVESANQIGGYYFTYGGQFCPGISSSDFGSCDIFNGVTCDCTCVESGGDPKCGTGAGYNCIDPDSTCAFEVCGAAGGVRPNVGNGICEAENNIEACEFDGGDCCSCDCVEPQSACGTGDDACITPVWSCVDSLTREGGSYGRTGLEFCPEFVVFDDFGDCDVFGDFGCDCTCVEGGGDPTCGTGTGYDCIDPDSTCAPTPCTTSNDCTVPGEECCPVKLVCEVPETTNPLACGDPHMTGFRGQKFDFTGEDGEWYCLISDLPSMHVNMRVTSPVPSLPEITYITGLSVVTTDAEGVEHSVVIEVINPHNLDSTCPAGVSPCLADGALSVFIDGSEELLHPGTVSVAPGVKVSAVNLPGECRSFGFEKYWERKKLEYAQAAGRKLSAEQNMAEWVLGDPTATNMAECVEYVAKVTTVSEAGLFEHQSEHASFQIVMPTATIRLSHGRLHQLPMRDPTDRFDLPDHTTWQMNMAVDHNDVSREATGVLGETLVPTLDDSGMLIMQGMGAIRGSEEDYRVEGPLGVQFVQGKIN